VGEENGDIKNKVVSEAWGCSPVVEHSSCMHKALGLIPNTEKSPKALTPLTGGLENIYSVEKKCQ
jgi:hypothetical protein